MNLKSGYAYEYVGKREWKSSDDEDWDIVVVTESQSQYLGKRMIDGSLMKIHRIDSKIFAQL